jgi:hypothetical protein
MLLLAFDLLIDLVAIINGTYRVMVEVDVKIYAEREKFYQELRGDAMQVRTVSDIEQRFLRQHPNYVAPKLEACIELEIKPNG